MGYLANEAIRSGRIIGTEGDYIIVAIHKDVIARRRRQQRDSLRVRRAKARAEYLASIRRTPETVPDRDVVMEAIEQILARLEADMKSANTPEHKKKHLDDLRSSQAMRSGDRSRS